MNNLTVISKSEHLGTKLLERDKILGFIIILILSSLLESFKTEIVMSLGLRIRVTTISWCLGLLY